MKFMTDFLVIGSGISGLSFALKVAEFATVTIITKKDRAASATNLAQGGIAVVLGKEDSFDLHIRDTLESGAGLCNEDVVRLVVTNGPERVRELIALGVQFNRAEDDPSRLDLGKEGGHSARRIAHAFDLTGQEIEEALLRGVARHPRITMLENHVAIDLLIGSKAGVRPNQAGFTDICLGAYVLDREQDGISTCLAKTTVVCTGGTGKVYLYTTNPDISTGDGIAMAYRAGATVANLEFVQFHPTCLFHPKVRNFLISEAVRGEGGRLIDERGRAFMEKYDPRKDLATRDTVARAIDAEMKASGDDCVYLDITHRSAAFIKKRFPNIYKTCLTLGIDMAKDPIPVVPAAHYMCGGVLTDIWGRSTIENLYALGETACTGLHGGNRLASNSLLEAVVFAQQAFLRCKADWDSLPSVHDVEVSDWESGAAGRLQECILINYNWDKIRRLMWNYVGIVRSNQRLALAQDQLSPVLREIKAHYRNYFLTPDLVELRNLALIAELILKSAMLRKESRGLHFNMDHPEPDDLHWKRDTILRAS